MKIKILYKQVGKPAEVREIEDDHNIIREMCGGAFSGYSVTSFLRLPALRNVYLFCNDTGKLDGLPPNCFIGPELLVGDIVFYAYDEHGEGMNLTALQCEFLRAALQHVL